MAIAPETKIPWPTRLRRGFLWLVGLGLLGVVFLEILIHTTRFPDSTKEPLNGTPVIYDAEGGVLATLAEKGARSRVVGKLSEMGRWLPEVTVALEDHRFYDHSGVDPYAIVAAAWSDIRASRLRRGGSTITQQVIKQDLGKRGRDWRRKWLEAILALKLEREWTKRQVLEGYLNRLDYGNRRIGAESASLSYFGKRCGALTLAEAVYLAGLPQAPTRYNPWKNPKKALQKYERSINRLVKVGYLKPSQGGALVQAPPLPEKFKDRRRARHYVDAMRRSLTIDLSGTVVTYLDPEIQTQANDLLGGQLQSLRREDIRNGAVVVIENATGQVKALTAFATEAAEDTSAINAAMTPRHAGSTLKPFVYQQALEEQVCSTASVLTDTAQAVAVIYPDYDPKNYNKRYYGPVRLREALGNSLNIPAILVSHKVGSRRAFERLAEWSLRPHDSFGADGAGFVLGNRRVTLLDLTTAYSVLARGGLSIGGPVFSSVSPVSPSRVADRAACRLVEDILCDNGARSRAFGSQSVMSFPANRRTAVKTGTSSNFRDAWIVGYNRSHTVGVWVGNLDGRSMNKALSVDVAGPVWRQLMDWLGEHRPAPGLIALDAVNDGLISVEIDSLTGALPVTETRRRLWEWFLPGTQPEEAISSWYEGGKIVLPAAYVAWCQSPHNHLKAGSRNPWCITSPSDGAHYVIDPALPLGQQRLPFLTDHPEPEVLQWFLNDEASAGVGWPLVPGQWQVRAYDPGTGRSVTVTFEVES